MDHIGFFFLRARGLQQVAVARARLSYNNVAAKYEAWGNNSTTFYDDRRRQFMRRHYQAQF